MEVSGANPLIRDPFSRILVALVGQAWVRLADANSARRDGDEHGQRVTRISCDYRTVYTHVVFFDEYFRLCWHSAGR